MHSLLPLLQLASPLAVAVVDHLWEPVHVKTGDESEMICFVEPSQSTAGGGELGEIKAVLMRPRKRTVLKRGDDGTVYPAVATS